MTDNAKRIAEDIQQEQEWTPAAAALHDQIIRQFTQKITLLIEKHPEAIAKATAIIVEAGPGKEIFVLTDPATADIVTELQRLAKQGVNSPLEALAKAKLPL